ncbi:MAG: hypothetical protein AMS25_03115 [Gemmatimonas sp. SM23_52]|nr:MAG: hypothetical protein AMS25_03115 [Gemmatimonas sp. SM23_52]
MSSLTWLDYSEHERRKALDVIDLFKQKETRDELGIGVIRDNFADLFFPGTSTIQTRARYFLFIPWMYTSLERKRVASSDIAGRARREETRLIEELAVSDDPDGTIGIEARASLKRLPSNIYWNGLGILGIRLYPGSQDAYHRSLDRFYAVGLRAVMTDDGEPIEGGRRANWHLQLPAPPSTFPNGASFKLTKVEADYLSDRILNRAAGALLAFLIDRGRIGDSTEFPWEHPQYAEFPVHVQDQLSHARNFSEVIHGAALLYNLMLAETAANSDLINVYRSKLGNWAELLQSRWSALQSWDQARFWRTAQSEAHRVSLHTRHFIQTWFDLALDESRVGSVAEDKAARQLIHARERMFKKGRARLDNRRALDLWSGQAGTARLDYRWSVSQTILHDILSGLSR